MGRDIDLTDPDSWDEDDVRYLGDRGQLPADERWRYDEMVVPPQEMPLEERANTGDANTSGLSKAEFEEKAASFAESAEDEEVDEVDEGLEPPYADDERKAEGLDPYSKDELIAELAQRAEAAGEDPNISGRKAELAARLAEQDAEG